MRHDYNLPADWEAMTPEERDKWFHEERCRRQAMSQKTPYRVRMERYIERVARREAARNTHVLGDEE
jgi:hypothetical protein